MGWGGGALAGVAVLCVSGCVTELPEPTYTTALGVKVYLFGQSISPEAVDAAAEEVLREFPELFDPDRGRKAAAQASVSFLPVDSYELYGRKVAGNVSLDGQWIYVAATVPLSQTALVHEWVHFFDLQLHGGTDTSHASWAPRVYAGIEAVNARLAESTEVAKARSAPWPP